MSIEEGLKDTFSTETLVMVFVAFLTYTVARLLQSYLFSKVQFLTAIPEVADLVTIIAAASLTHGETRDAAVTGGGLALLNDLGSRFGVTWLKVGA